MMKQVKNCGFRRRIFTLISAFHGFNYLNHYHTFEISKMHFCKCLCMFRHLKSNKQTNATWKRLIEIAVARFLLLSLFIYMNK